MKCIGILFIVVKRLMYSSSICSSVPSILRNSRYRRDQRQLEEEEEMWFNEDDDFDDGEAVVPAASDILSKKLDSDIDSIGMWVQSLVRIPYLRVCKPHIDF